MSIVANLKKTTVAEITAALNIPNVADIVTGISRLALFAKFGVLTFAAAIVGLLLSPWLGSSFFSFVVLPALLLTAILIAGAIYQVVALVRMSRIGDVRKVVSYLRAVRAPA